MSFSNSRIWRNRFKYQIIERKSRYFRWHALSIYAPIEEIFRLVCERCDGRGRGDHAPNCHLIHKPTFKNLRKSLIYRNTLKLAMVKWNIIAYLDTEGHLYLYQFTLLINAIHCANNINTSKLFHNFVFLLMFC